MSSPSPPICKITSLDHIVLTVRSLERTIAFYTKILGMTHEAFKSPKDTSVERHSLKYGTQKINLHESGNEFEPKARNVMPGSGDLCFLTETSVDEILRELNERSVEVLEEGKVVERIGARGNLRSIYVRDPDGNLVEISNYA